MKKPAIPAIAPNDASHIAALSALKENVEVLTGLRAGQIADLPTTATLADVIAKTNEIIDRMMNR